MTDKIKALDLLAEYMKNNEDDIAFGIDGFSELREPFELFFGKKAKSTDHLGRVVIDGKRVDQ